LQGNNRLLQELTGLFSKVKALDDQRAHASKGPRLMSDGALWDCQQALLNKSISVAMLKAQGVPILSECEIDPAYWGLIMLALQPEAPEDTANVPSTSKKPAKEKTAEIPTTKTTTTTTTTTSKQPSPPPTPRRRKIVAAAKPVDVHSTPISGNHAVGFLNPRTLDPAYVTTIVMPTTPTNQQGSNQTTVYYVPNPLSVCS
jgi:hypothetical protein